MTRGRPKDPLLIADAIHFSLSNNPITIQKIKAIQAIQAD